MYATLPTWPAIQHPAAARPPGPVTEPTDAELVAAARRDPLAFDRLYRRYLPAVYRYVRARVATADDAEDITSVAFLSALQSLARYEERGLFAAWLFTIARRQIIAHRRAQPSRAADALDDAGARGLASPGAEPDAAGVEARDAIRAALVHLSPDQQEAITLRFYGGLRVMEIGAILGKDESAVKMILHRGLRKLRDGLAAITDDVQSGGAGARAAGDPNAGGGR